jgi:glycosyltransferase involved in cell wall biosynthesis
MMFGFSIIQKREQMHDKNYRPSLRDLRMKPLVSILIPAYNSEKCIAETLHSAIRQSWPNKEIIVVDDGSKDKTAEIAQGFKRHGVRVVTQNNHGAATARNNAFRLSKGEYIQWLDADDLLSPDKIEKQMCLVQQIRNYRVLMSCGWGRFLYRYHRADFVPTSLWTDLAPAEWLLRKMSQNLHMQTATWLVSRELTEAAGPWDVTQTADDDGEYFCRVLLKSDGVRFVPESRVYYRDSGAGSLSCVGDSALKQDTLWESMQRHMNSLKALENSSRVNDACVTYMQNRLVSFYPNRTDLIRKMEDRAQDFQGHLEMPRLSWKYSWIEPLVGQTRTWQLAVLLPRLKWSLLRLCDKYMFLITHKWRSPSVT